MNPWFRMYTSVLDDPKVQKLPAETFRGWVNLLCLAKEHSGDLPSVDDISFRLRMSRKKAATLIEHLEKAGLIDGDGRPHNWDERQFQSDGSTERVQRYRERKRNVSGNGDETLHETEHGRYRKQQPDVTETPRARSESESETDTEQSKSSPPVVPPRRKRRIDPGFKPSGEDRAWAKAEGFTEAQIGEETAQFVDHWVSKGESRLEWWRSWRNWMRNSRKFGGSKHGRRSATERWKRNLEALELDDPLVSDRGG